MCSMIFFFFKQTTAYEIRISDWSSDVCSSDLQTRLRRPGPVLTALRQLGLFLDLSHLLDRERRYCLNQPSEMVDVGAAAGFGPPLLATDIPCPLQRSDVLLDRARMNVHRLRHRGLGRKGLALRRPPFARQIQDRKSTRLNSSH